MAKLCKNSARLFSQLKVDTLTDKFRGCLVGGLVGDCYGRPYKLSEEVSKAQLQKYFDKLDGPYFKAPFKPFSACTALSNCVASSLVSLQNYDATDISKRFVKEYYDNPHRDYGNSVSKIILELRGSKFSDPFEPARKLYFGMGSYGNGAAARVAPIALFYRKNPQKMLQVATEASNITNANKLARDGAILQSWAIRLALNQEPSAPVDVSQFLASLNEKLKEFETDEEGLDLKDVHKFKEQLKLVEKLLDLKDSTEHEVINTLGHSNVAVYSVPTAVFSFLRSTKEIPGIETDNPYRRTIQYSTALGGDANTIASMAGAMAGACYGYTSISEPIQKHCEGTADVLSLADKLASSLS